jgi:hypothetical protein
VNRFKQQLLVAGIFAVLLITGTLMNTHTAGAQGPADGLAVRVVNTPLAVTGSTTVAGSVTANQGGTWNVGIVGTPTVLTRSLEEPGRVPYQQQVQIGVNTSLCDAYFCGANFAFGRVPADKRLVITQVAVSATMANGASVTPASLYGGSTIVPGTTGLFPSVEMPVPITRQQTTAVFGAYCPAAAPCEQWAMNQAVTYYVEANGTPGVTFAIDKNHVVPIFMNAVLTGYYVSLP